MGENYKDEATLRRLYIDENLSQREIAETLGGITGSTIGYWLNKYGIDKQKSSQIKFEPPIQESKLRSLYCQKKLSQTEIADRLGYSQKSIGNYLKEYGIETRGPGGVQEPNFDRDRFEELYIEQGYGLRPISKELGVTRNTLARWRDRWGIEPHNAGNRKRDQIDDGKLVRLYVKEELSQSEIANELDIDVNQTTVSRWLRELKINTRNKAGWGQLVETNRGETVKSKLEQRTANWLHKNNIEYEYEPNIDGTLYVPDFRVGCRLIECWGVRSSENYEERRDDKISEYESLGFDVISVWPIIGDRPSVDEVLSEVAWENLQIMKN